MGFWNGIGCILWVVVALGTVGGLIWFIFFTRLGLRLLLVCVVLSFLASVGIRIKEWNDGRKEQKELATYGDEVMRLRRILDGHAIADWAVTSVEITAVDDGVKCGIIMGQVTGVSGRKYPLKIEASWNKDTSKWESAEEADLRLRLLDVQEAELLRAKRTIEMMQHR